MGLCCDQARHAPSIVLGSSSDDGDEFPQDPTGQFSTASRNAMSVTVLSRL